MSNNEEQEVAAKPNRLLSLDALRGFDMFWIVGAEEVAHALTKMSDAPWAKAISEQLSHRTWEGFAFYDLIFPLFIFIVGISLVFSVSHSLEAHGKAKTLRRVFIRALILYLLGLFYYGGITNGLDQVRLLGVLQRIAICYFFASLAYCFLATKGRIVLCTIILGGYWALMTFVPVPDVGAGNFEEGKNLANYVDKQYLPLFKWNGDHDPEGLLSTIPAIATCLLGVFAGSLLRSTTIKDALKVVYLLTSGIALVALGYLWGMEFPVIKKLWTSSYVLVAAGYSCLFMAFFYLVIEIIGFRIWAMPFVWIGMNPITIYLAHKLLNFDDIANRIAGGPVKAALGPYGELVILGIVLSFSLWIVHFLYRKQIFLRV
ncbi:heparan-alpha-glucosaminide N-acetyltransferase domain-containing protein [bacterium]|jgi:predicted acyltransferase|nr:heparan-alpha-glucosaminide N-acetyltransferase domain-containing protein [bacterium]MDA7510827.1 heparan-alpha-glucosaminide N-acetyltransferase domain-containing protein [Verrucomicrobiota bacterium]MDA7657914.1 heparan-alpha-glucosaminide N-acetyltransferase domain-containing protein [Verrucomicrobiota bacterium]MDA7867300.1 heparan-alpha-glucosaminide N-acetyltransferase domain-containing protein [Verrucomicrobiota bacterium]